MKALLKCITLILVFQFSPNLSAQFASIQPRGIRGSAGFGLAEYDIKKGASDFKMDGGLFTTIQGEAEVSGPLLVTVHLNFLQATGRSNYDYSTLSQRYTGQDLSFSAQTFQIGLGFKYRPFEAVLSPYIEGGGLVGYYQISYKNAATKVTPSGDYKNKDSLIELGYYGDAGLEVRFSEEFGLIVGYRLQIMDTRTFETLGNTTLRYQANIIHFGVSRAF